MDSCIDFLKVFFKIYCWWHFPFPIVRTSLGLTCHPFTMNLPTSGSRSIVFFSTRTIICQVFFFPVSYKYYPYIIYKLGSRVRRFKVLLPLLTLPTYESLTIILRHGQKIYKSTMMQDNSPVPQVTYPGLIPLQILQEIQIL